MTQDTKRSLQSDSNGRGAKDLSSSAKDSSPSPAGAALEYLQDCPYPTNSVHFLQTLTERQKGSRHDPKAREQAKVQMKIIVVGAGLGGLATSIALARRGHKVTVLEQAPALGEVGAGIQVPPNSSRLLLRWGLGPFLAKSVVEPEGINFRRWENGDLIGLTKLFPDFRENFDAPYYVVHRADLHNALHRLALDLNIDIQLGRKVAAYDGNDAVVHMDNGRSLSADLIIAADGIKSVARAALLGDRDLGQQKTGFAAYRATVDVERMLKDPDTAALLERPALNLWVGEQRHVMTYTIAGGKSFNMVLSHVDHSDPSTWSQTNSISDMREYFRDWDPRLIKVIHMVESTMKWPLLTGYSLSTWLAGSKKLLILGDAAHAMVPYMSQGAAMAVEDGAALAEALNLASSMEDIPTVLRTFEKERVRRTSQMQTASLVNGKLWHFPDGPEQRARDEAMKPEVEGKHFLRSPNQWSDPVTQWWSYGYDAEEAIRQAWRTECRARNGSKL